MKNIYILPTDQPSRLYAKDGNYKLANGTIAMDWYISSVGYKPLNIYITSDEEIKEGDYCVDGNDIYGPYEDGDIATDKFIKIILTTDSQLIRYGVQAIGDEFLEWFVKNPTCGFVEVKHKDIIQYGNMTMKDFNGDGSYYVCTDCGDLEVSRSKQEVLKFGVEYYKIIIPQEEPKQNQDPCNFCGKTLREQMKGCGEITCYRQFITKQETLEEAAEKLAPNSSWRLGFIAGGNYMAERMYSEEDLDTFRRFMIQEQNFSKSCLDVFVKQFKNK